MLISVRNKRTGKVYDSSMKSDASILEIHFCTSYTEVIVQDEIVNDSGNKSYPTHSIFIPVESNSSWIDLIAIQNDDEGEFVNNGEV